MPSSSGSRSFSGLKPLPGEQHKLLETILDAVYVDPLDERTIVAIRPKPAFRALFDMAATTDGSGISLNRTNLEGSEECRPCFYSSKDEHPNPHSWWRRGRVELPVQRLSRVERYRLSRST